MAFFYSSSSTAQTGLFTAIAPPTDTSACVDSAPFDDEFGWNGICGCMLNQAVRGFGNTLDINNGVAAIGSIESPVGCVGSGSISVYENTNGSWQQTAALAPTNNSLNDAFPNKVSIGSDVIVADSNLSSFPAITPRKLTIFELGADGGWQQVQQILSDRLTSDRSQTFAHDKDKIVLLQNSMLVTYVRGSDKVWRETSSLTIENLSKFEVSEDTLVTVSFTGTLAIYQYIDRTWQVRSEFSVERAQSRSSVSLEGNTIVYSPRSFPGSTTVHTYARTGDGSWVDTTSVEVEPLTQLVGESVILGGVLPLELRPTVSASPSGTSFLYMRDVLQDFSFSSSSFNFSVPPDVRLFTRSSNQWIESDEIVFSSDLNFSNQIGFSSAYDGENVLLGTRDENTVIVFGVDSNGRFTNSTVNVVNAAPVAGCDYSNSASFDGWGWNATTSESCAPLETVSGPQPTTQCIDSDGDGWGWDGTGSCTVNASTVVTTAVDPNCDYSDADLYGGWGWNSTASQSCAPLETVSSPQPTSPCIDVDGDGWGWDGSASCIP